VRDQRGLVFCVEYWYINIMQGFGSKTAEHTPNILYESLKYIFNEFCMKKQ